MGNNIIKGLIISLFVVIGSVNASTDVKLIGELKKWHKVTFQFDGPDASEDDEYNPFVNYKLNVTFTHQQTKKSYKVPGYFAADGNAEQTSATGGNKWRVHFSPDEIGEWQWQASFIKGNYVAVSVTNNTGLSAGFMDNQTGTFNISPTDKTAPDFRAKGRLQYVNQPYLRFAESGGYFIKAGPDSPENLLSYADFDGTYHNDGFKDHLVKKWQPHVQDWKDGDPTWQEGKGKGLIGAVNYLASKGMNSMSFLTLNIVGDDQNVFPYVDNKDHLRFDVSKLAQWEVVFEHAQKNGIFLHFKTQEVENQGLLDNGGMGLERKLYYRELIARFGHHLALNWNLGEENGEWHPNPPTPPQTTSERLAMAQYFKQNDPYQHHRVIHNGQYFHDIAATGSHYTGASVQTSSPDFSQIHGAVIKLRDWPVNNGRPLAIAVDEPGDAEYALRSDELNPEHFDARSNGLWGALTAGAWGTEWYFGYKNEHSDLTAQDWRTRDKFWQQAKHAIDFFNMANLDLPGARNQDNYASNAWVLAKDKEFYVLYTKDASKGVSLKLPGEPANYSVRWFDPRNGGSLQQGSVTALIQDQPFKHFWIRHEKSLGEAPSTPNKDWVILIKRK
ncbi:MAG: DUF5060 domain-containing protein [Gammaproteobacteria bacterium]|nr:DUF5060 domain-containing protein [Gammaproteobacteria bacterium]